jgi:predicted lipoprotein with Yx(FWY)xxD motif
MPTYPGMSSSLYSVNVANKPNIGSYLTNATGWTLYTFARDIPTNGTSRCTGNCIKNWPAFYTTSLTLSPGLDTTSFTVITRPDGGKQIAYNGYPLYYFRNDTKPGDTNGQGFLKLWFAATYPAPTTSLTSTTTATASSTTTVPKGKY